MAEAGPRDALFAALGAERPIGQALSTIFAKDGDGAVGVPAGRAGFGFTCFFGVRHGPVGSAGLVLGSQHGSSRAMMRDAERLWPTSRDAFASRIALPRPAAVFRIDPAVGGPQSVTPPAPIQGARNSWG